MKKAVICILICMLMTISTMVPIPATPSSEKKSQPLNMGNILYVGGSGPNNYTKIQDAIDNATNGDTVFVFDDSSPYYETVMINTSLSLQGEDKDTTIINGSLGDYPDTNFTIGVSINADNVTVRGFTIQGCNLTGIAIAASTCTITTNILSDNYYGIAMGAANDTQVEGSNIIIDNLFLRNVAGIYVSGGLGNIITGNVFSQNTIGITVALSANTNISHNIISECDRGVTIIGSYKTVVYRNNISDNKNVGVTTWLTSADRILQNNFIGNAKNAETAQYFLFRFLVFKKELNFPIRRNVWDGNYWDKPRSLPYKIPGAVWFAVDWHPAQEPYEI
jgi:parallel beta-helix repeat protein